MRFLWTYFFGSLLAALPRRWRRNLRKSDINWTRAGVASGFLECLAAIVALGYWYMFQMSRIVNASLDAATTGKLGPGITDQQISALALTVLLTHPLTWFLAYCVLEGSTRLCAAAFTESAYGILPLALIDWSASLLHNREHTKEALSEFLCFQRSRAFLNRHSRRTAGRTTLRYQSWRANSGNLCQSPERRMDRP